MAEISPPKNIGELGKGGNPTTVKELLVKWDRDGQSKDQKKEPADKEK